jgi:(R,R)-butanediol dehydrogenase/meso-butanediol dehydrogenase/diacetyl reductase
VKHQAVIYRGGGVFETTLVPTLTPSPGQVQIEVAYTGICGTDLKIAHGAMDGRFHDAWPIGHEMSGTISAVGDGVTDWAQGDKVTVMPLRWCGRCPACLAGHSHICRDLDFVGIDSPGSLQQRWNVDADLLVRLPDALGLREAALVEPVAVAVHDVRRARLDAADHVVVVGAGPIGLLIAIVARYAGASVLLSEVSQARRALAASFGFTVIDPTDGLLGQRVRDWSDDKGADVAFEVSGSTAGALAISEVLKVRGRAVVVAIHSAPVPVNLFELFWKELEIIGARVYQRHDFDEAIRLVDGGEVPVERLVSDVVPLVQATAAIERLAAGGDVLKILVDCR